MHSGPGFHFHFVVCNYLPVSNPGEERQNAQHATEQTPTIHIRLSENRVSLTPFFIRAFPRLPLIKSHDGGKRISSLIGKVPFFYSNNPLPIMGFDHCVNSCGGSPSDFLVFVFEDDGGEEEEDMLFICLFKESLEF